MEPILEGSNFMQIYSIDLFNIHDKFEGFPLKEVHCLDW